MHTRSHARIPQILNCVCVDYSHKQQQNKHTHNHTVCNRVFITVSMRWLVYRQEMFKRKSTRPCLISLSNDSKWHKLNAQYFHHNWLRFQTTPKSKMFYSSFEWFESYVKRNAAPAECRIEITFIWHFVCFDVDCGCQFTIEPSEFVINQFGVFVCAAQLSEL